MQMGLVRYGNGRTAKQQVLDVYPQAKAANLGRRIGWSVSVVVEGKERYLAHGQSTADRAWTQAWEKIEKERSNAETKTEV